MAARMVMKLMWIAVEAALDVPWTRTVQVVMIVLPEIVTL